MVSFPKASQKYLQPRQVPAALWIIDCLQGDSGGRTRARTWDPLIKSQLLYQLSYAPGLPSAGEAPSGDVRLAKADRGVQPRKTGIRTKDICNEKPPGEPGGFSGMQPKARVRRFTAAADRHWAPWGRLHVRPGHDASSHPCRDDHAGRVRH